MKEYFVLRNNDYTVIKKLSFIREQNNKDNNNFPTCRMLCSI